MVRITVDLPATSLAPRMTTGWPGPTPAPISDIFADGLSPAAVGMVLTTRQPQSIRLYLRERWREAWRGNEEAARGGRLNGRATAGKSVGRSLYAPAGRSEQAVREGWRLQHFLVVHADQKAILGRIGEERSSIASMGRATMASTARQAFIKSAAAAAKECEQQTGVCASVTIAQAILESGWGEHHMGTLTIISASKRR